MCLQEPAGAYRSLHVSVQVGGSVLLGHIKHIITAYSK